MCSLADCETCQAEKEAILFATRWFDQDKDSQIDIHPDTEPDNQSYIRTEEDSQTHIYTNTGEDGIICFRGQMLQVYPQLENVMQVTSILLQRNLITYKWQCLSSTVIIKRP